MLPEPEAQLGASLGASDTHASVSSKAPEHSMPSRGPQGHCSATCGPEHMHAPTSHPSRTPEEDHTLPSVTLYPLPGPPPPKALLLSQPRASQAIGSAFKASLPPRPGVSPTLTSATRDPDGLCGGHPRPAHRVARVDTACDSHSAGGPHPQAGS